METSDSSDVPPTPSNDQATPWRPFVEGLRRFIFGRVPASDAEDVVQDTLVRLHESTSSLRNGDRAEAWVFAVARNTIADYYRQNERRPVDGTIGRAEEIAADGSPLEENLEPFEGAHDVHEEVLSWLRPFAETLPDMYRQPLIMADFEGYKQKEVADELGLSLSGAKSRIQRARRKLEDRIRRCCRVEFGPEGRAIAFHRHQKNEEGGERDRSDL